VVRNNNICNNNGVDGATTNDAVLLYGTIIVSGTEQTDENHSDQGPAAKRERN